MDSKGSATKSEERVRTVLGSLRTNPFTTTNMATAYNNLYDSSIQEMPTTDLYVEFHPNSVSDIEKLYATDYVFYDFPLEYELISLGDYYDEAEGEEFPTLYAVVPPDFSISNVSYTILANLYLSDSNPRLNAEALRITGNASEITNYTGFDLEEVADEDMGMIPIQPECESGCVAKLRLVSPPNSAPVWEWYCDCTPPPPSTSCDPYPSERKPSGVFRVEDSQLSNSNNTSSFLPVKDVEVIVKDMWFSSIVTSTSASGCWRVGHKFYGKAWIYVRFRNNRCKIRGTGSGIKVLWKWITPLKYKVCSIWGPNYQNIEVNFHNWSTNGSKAHMCWGAATVNNALHDFYISAYQEGINNPPQNLNIFVGRNHTSGATTMAKKMGLYNFGVAVQVKLVYNHPWMYFFTALPTICFNAATVTLIFPDVYIGIDFKQSDRLKELSYHELAHSSHYTKVGNPFWQDLIVAEADAWGHGNANSTDAGRIALCESWAEHIGKTFADKTYGANVSFTTYLNYIYWLEHQRNEETNHIPIGFYHDLIDGINTSETAGDGYWGQTNQGTINDNVSGLTNAQLFSLLNSNITTPLDFKNALNNSSFINGSNTTQKVNNLFNSY
jgi:hypothetical protein